MTRVVLTRAEREAIVRSIAANEDRRGDWTCAERDRERLLAALDTAEQDAAALRGELARVKLATENTHHVTACPCARCGFVGDLNVCAKCCGTLERVAAATAPETEDTDR